MANRLESCVRETDTVARMGGDEFTVLLTDHHSKEADTLISHADSHMVQINRLRSVAINPAANRASQY